MCGRLVITEPDLSVFVEPFGVQRSELGPWQPRFNLAPTQLAPLVTNEPERRLTLARFGLVPHWARGGERQASRKLINARVEGVARSRAFSAALTQRRGIVPVTGYFEWQSVAGKRRPQFIHDASGEPLALATVWERWRAADGQSEYSFAVLTRPSLGFLHAIHTRMPLSLRGAELEAWLSPETRTALELRPVLEAEPQVSRMRQEEVSALANSVRNDSPECIAKARDHVPAVSGPRQLSLFDGPRDLLADDVSQVRGTR